ncbi:SRPBCC family protein [Parasphingopyxis algicola]|uniref:SRPBCC family protein n=1 Tax=Parasphingopyxis algicola TaxID=2026624 RepID=UPI0015A4A9D7|nr:SRPBCC family protein [Parasphingopyxis algicola]QLC26444.1 SRPBCC family protein [Parasphingopyxis algicola]
MSIGMREQVFLHATHIIDAPVDRVWAILGDFAHSELGKGFVRELVGDGNEVGAVRTLHIAEEFGGGTIVERQAARDESGCYYAYEILDYGPMPFDDYYGSAHAIPTGPRSTSVIWTNRYTAPAGDAEEFRQRSLAILNVLEGNMRRLVKDEPADNPSSEARKDCP